mmetsp:Transcript_12341/g.51943  ORF Transcript_12341/g.51943 Transcript_12341/m.51943 type:complete len:317 (+) Transcript_12341:239-1189(+)
MLSHASVYVPGRRPVRPPASPLSTPTALQCCAPTSGQRSTVSSKLLPPPAPEKTCVRASYPNSRSQGSTAGAGFLEEAPCAASWEPLFGAPFSGSRAPPRSGSLLMKKATVRLEVNSKWSACPSSTISTRKKYMPLCLMVTSVPSRTSLLPAVAYSACAAASPPCGLSGGGTPSGPPHTRASSAALAPADTTILRAVFSSTIDRAKADAALKYSGVCTMYCLDCMSGMDARKSFSASPRALDVSVFSLESEKWRKSYTVTALSSERPSASCCSARTTTDIIAATISACVKFLRMASGCRLATRHTSSGGLPGAPGA